MIDPVTYDLNRYLVEQERGEQLAEEADRQTADNRAEAIADCKLSDEKLADALADFADDTPKFVRLAHAIRMALGMSGCAARDQYLRDLVDEMAIAWGDSNHRRVTEEDVEAQLDDARHGL